jgi:CRP/FNR family transcriptional regulator, cyclic AMP receptor protein
MTQISLPFFLMKSNDNEQSATEEKQKQILREISLFNGLPKEAIEAICILADFRSTYKGQTIIEEGEEGGELILLLSGRVGICLESINPSVEIAINRLNAGQVIGEMSLLDGSPRSATVVAIEPCDLAVFETAPLNKIFGHNPEWGMIFMRNLAITMSARLRTMNRRILNLMRSRYF